MSIGLVPVDQVSPTPIRMLEPGAIFSLWWDSATGHHADQVVGMLLGVRGQGYARVRIRNQEGETETTEWSCGTLVIKEDDMADSAKKKSANLKSVAPEAEGNGKGKIAAKAPAKSKTADNPCLCGCGELVVSRFKPGHDARYYSQLKKVVAGDLKFTQLSKQAQKNLGDMGGVKKELGAHFKPKAPAKAAKVAVPAED